MAHPGTTFVNQAGEQLTFRQTSSDTNGALLEVEVRYRPNAAPPPVHYHPFQEEHFEVLGGAIQATIGGETHTYRAGEHFVVPRGVPHAMHNISDEPGQVRWQIRPALRTEAFFEAFWGLASEGKTNRESVPNILQLAVLLQAYHREFRLSKPPYAVQRILWAVLAVFGRWRGYRSQYERHDVVRL